jgi:LysM repeat protein
MRRLLILVTVVLLMAVSTGVALASGVHVVQPGETLSMIAVRYGTTVSALVTANSLWNPNFIYAGQRLVIPDGYTPPPYTPPTSGGSYYTVQYGDNLSRIAARYGTNAYAIAQANGIFNVNYVYAGQVLFIPRVPQIYNYYVQYGDTLASIAWRYGTTVWTIASYNGIYNPNLIYPGMLIRVPV